MSQRVWKAGDPATAALSCNFLCAASTFEHTRTWAYANCSISGKGQPEAVETSRHVVEAGHSTGGERGAASPFGFDAAEPSEDVTLARPDFDHRGGVLKKRPKDACYNVGAY